MYRTVKKSIEFALLGAALILYALLTPLLAADLGAPGAAAIAGLFFVFLSILQGASVRGLLVRLHRRVFAAGDTRYLGAFVDRLRFCFTTSDFIKAFRESIEYRLDGTVVLVDMPKRYIVYNSSTTVGTDPTVFAELVRHYDNWKDGVFFFDDALDLVSDHRKSRGFFLVRGPLQCFFFLRFIKYLEKDVFTELYGEYVSFLKRNETIEKMFAIAAVSKEWSMVADTQRAFLPKTLPAVKGMELASYFKPLVNVSGDYYDAIPIDEDRTLLLLGDVSGKGLAAALIMGIVVNTIRIMEDKTDLAAMVRTVDGAIKAMRLEDKYTVLFLALVDTARMTVRYINASMADPLIISETRAGRQIRRLASNCSLIGILELEEVAEAEAKLFPGDVILIASDGVSEVSDGKGEMLGDSEGWIDFVTDESMRPAEEFVSLMADLVEKHSAGQPLRDDVTILAARITE